MVNTVYELIKCHHKQEKIMNPLLSSSVTKLEAHIFSGSAKICGHMSTHYITAFLLPKALHYQIH